jgi:hypothetical protein
MLPARADLTADDGKYKPAVQVLVEKAKQTLAASIFCFWYVHKCNHLRKD